MTTTAAAPRFKNGVDIDAAIEQTKQEILRYIHAEELWPGEIKSFDDMNEHTCMNGFLYMDAPRGAGLDAQVRDHVRRSGLDPESLERQPAPSGDAFTELVMEARALVVEEIDAWLASRGHVPCRTCGVLSAAD